MIRFLLKVAALLVVGILGYNYFLGDDTEKAQSREIVGKAVDLGKDAWNLLQNEKDKFDEGKYDDAVEKLQGLYGELRQTASRLKDSGALERLSELESKRKELADQLSSETPEVREQAEQDLEKLTEATEVLMHELETQNQE